MYDMYIHVHVCMYYVCVTIVPMNMYMHMDWSFLIIKLLKINTCTFALNKI